VTGVPQFRRRAIRTTPWLPWLVVALAAYPAVLHAQQPQPPPPVPAAPPPAAGALSPSANRLVVAPGSGRNLSANIILRARAYLIAAAAEMCPACQVIDAGALTQVAPIDSQTASSLAGQFSADLVLALDLDRAQYLTRLTLVAFRRASPQGRTAEPQVLSQVTNEGPEALWPLVRSLVAQLYQRVPASSPAAAALDRPRPAAPRRFFLAAGAGMVTQLNSAGRNDLFLPAFAVAVAHHADTSMIDVRLDLAMKDDLRRTGVGLSYAFRSGPNWSWGLTASWVWLNLGGRGANGPAVAPLVSYLIPIAGGPSFRFEAGYVVNLFREQEVDRLIPGSDAAHLSHGPQLFVGVVL
jgi:hypothetical protein